MFEKGISIHKANELSSEEKRQSKIRQQIEELSK